MNVPQYVGREKFRALVIPTQAKNKQTAPANARNSP